MKPSNNKKTYESVSKHLTSVYYILLPLVRDYESKFALLSEAVSDMCLEEHLLAWDKFHDIVTNSGGEPDELKPPIEYWYHLAQAARLMVNTNG